MIAYALSWELIRAVIDTNVLVGALTSAKGLNRKVIRACLTGAVQPFVGEALFREYEDVFGRSKLVANSPLSLLERADFLDAFFSVSTWVPIYFSWRPNLRDEGDNHVFELAVAAGVEVIVTHNIRDLQNGELRFPDIRVVRPAELLSMIEKRSR